MNALTPISRGTPFMPNRSRAIFTVIPCGLVWRIKTVGGTGTHYQGDYPSRVSAERDSKALAR